MSLTFAAPNTDSVPLYLLNKDGMDAFLEDQPEPVATWVRASGFSAGLGQALLIPGDDGAPTYALGGFGTAKARSRGRFPLAAVAAALPAGTYHLASSLPAGDLETEALGWLLTGYTFHRYAGTAKPRAQLVAPDGIDTARIEALAAGEALTRDLSVDLAMSESLHEKALRETSGEDPALGDLNQCAPQALRGLKTPLGVWTLRPQE